MRIIFNGINVFGGSSTKYSEKFNKAVSTILKHEGGYVNHPNDPGGETRYGISKHSYPDIDIKHLTLDDAKVIYFRDWWVKHNYENFEFVVGEKVFDMAVNMGARRAHKLLQKAANDLGVRPQLKVDGIIGRNTLTRVNSLNGSAVREELRRLQKQYYLNLIAKRPSLAVFKNGWLRRASA